MSDNSERMRILELIDSGQITAEEGLRLLAALPTEEETSSLAFDDEPDSAEINIGAPESASTGQMGGTPEPGAETPAGARAEAVEAEVLPENKPPDFERWRQYWLIPFWIGVGITIFGGLMMGLVLQSSASGFWFFCATIPFLIGVLVMFIGWQSRRARWLHLRVKQSPGERPQNIRISLPLPVGLTAWFMRTFRNRIPGMESVPENVDQMLYAVRDGTSAENPIFIKVDDEDGEQVEIYIG